MFRDLAEALVANLGGSLDDRREEVSKVTAAEIGDLLTNIFRRSAPHENHQWFVVPRTGSILTVGPYRHRDALFSPTEPYVWRHLFYAYCVENTRICDVFRKILWEYLNGEKLGSPSEDALAWCWTTAQVFYNQFYAFTGFSLVNDVRPAWPAIRRNAYYRFFGIELNHPPQEGEVFHKAPEHNDTFIETFERLLAEAWTGYRYRTSTTGTNPTDPAAIAFLCKKLREMLEARRLGKNLRREEFLAVAHASWLQLAVDFNSPIVRAIGTESSSAHERLKLLGQAVGVGAHSKSESFLLMADPGSRLLQRIEAGDLDDAANAGMLYDGSSDPDLTNDVQEIITHWSITTGRDIKDLMETSTDENK